MYDLEIVEASSLDKQENLNGVFLFEWHSWSMTNNPQWLRKGRRDWDALSLGNREGTGKEGNQHWSTESQEAH